MSSREGKRLKTDGVTARISSVGRRGVTVILQSGEEVSARVAGRVYKEVQPVTGDSAEVDCSGDVPVVERILPRHSMLRRSSSHGRDFQIIASNVDTVLAVVSVKRPAFSHGFLSRVLAAARWMDIPAKVAVNKIDLQEDDGQETEEIIAVYGPGGAGYQIFPVSCITGEGMEELWQDLSGSTAVLTGPSGAGKTSLVKKYNPSLDLKIGSLNPRTWKGRHTTVAARLIPLASDTMVIDTPGLRLFSIDDIPAESIQFCFPEFDDLTGSCRFNDCLHVSEPRCAVKEAVEEGAVSKLRYDIYRGFVSEATSS